MVFQGFVICFNLSDLVEWLVLVRLFLADPEHFPALPGRQEFTFAVKKLQGIPFSGVVAGGYDDRAVRFMFMHGHGYSRRCGYPRLNYVTAHRLQGGDNNLFTNRSRHARVTADDDFPAFSPAAESGGKAAEIFRC